MTLLPSLGYFTQLSISPTKCGPALYTSYLLLYANGPYECLRQASQFHNQVAKFCILNSQDMNSQDRRTKKKIPMQQKSANAKNFAYKRVN